MATADGVAFGKSGEPEHRHVNARCLAGDDRRQHLAQPRAELESVAGKSCRDVHAASTVGVLISPRAVWTARTRPPSTMSRPTAVFSQISAPSRRAAAANPVAVA